MSTNFDESAVPFPQVQRCIMWQPRYNVVNGGLRCDGKYRIWRHAMRRREKEKRLISIYTAFVPGTKYPPATVSCASRDCFRSCRSSATIFFNAFPPFESRLAVQTEKCARNTESFSNGATLIKLRSSSPLFLFLLFLISLLASLLFPIAPSFICVRIVSLPRNVRLIRTCYSRRQHKDNTLMRPTSAREGPAQFSVSFAVLTQWLLTTLS